MRSNWVRLDVIKEKAPKESVPSNETNTFSCFCYYKHCFVRNF